MVKELKHTEIGDIPVDWELQTFDETFRVISNNTLSRENLNNRGGAVRNIHYGDILTKFPEVLDCNEEEIPYVNELSLLSSSTQLLQDGDIVVADTAEDETVGKVIEVQNLGDSKLVAGLHTIPCRVKKGDFAPGWLGYYMNSDLFHNQILPYITGIKVSSISKGAISETLILVPPFDEQEKIVQSLNKIQLLMTSETKVVNKIKLVKNGCLSKMFPQKDDTVPEMRLPGFTEAWEQRKLSEICERITRKNRNNESDLPLTIASQFGLIDQRDFFNKIVAAKDMSNYYLLKKGEFAYNKSYSNGFDYGSIKRLNAYKQGCLSTLYICFGITSDEVESDYLECFFDTLKWYGDVSMICAEGARNHGLLNVDTKGFFDEVTVDLPKSLEEQKRISAYLNALNHLITLHQCKCDKYSNIKKGMMSDLLTGKIRLV